MDIRRTSEALAVERSILYKNNEYMVFPVQTLRMKLSTETSNTISHGVFFIDDAKEKHQRK